MAETGADWANKEMRSTGGNGPGIIGRRTESGPVSPESLAELLFGQNKFDDAHTHIERAKLHAINNIYGLGYAMELQARLWYEERRF